METGTDTNTSTNTETGSGTGLFEAMPPSAKALKVAKAANAAVVADTPPVEVHRVIAAPATAVFRYWSNPDLAKQWYGPETFTCPFAEFDFRVGGKYLTAMRSPEGKDIWSTGVYREIEPDRRLVLEDYPSNSRGEIQAPTGDGLDGPFSDQGPGRITVQFSQHEDGETTVYLRHDGLPSRMHDDCVNGWASALEKLKRRVETH